MSGDFMRDAISQRRQQDRRDLEAHGFPVAPDPPPAAPEPSDPAELRRQVAAERGVPPDAVGRLRGDTRAEIEADADELLTHITPVEPYQWPDMGGGVRGVRPPDPADSMEAQIRAAMGGGEPSGSEQHRAARQKLGW